MVKTVTLIKEVYRIRALRSILASAAGSPANHNVTVTHFYLSRNDYDKLNGIALCQNLMKTLSKVIFTLCLIAWTGPCVSFAQEQTPSQTRKAVLAGGCFWCIQPAFDKAPGVINTLVGYSGGTEPNPTYELVTSERTKYRECLEITYDPSKITFEQLLDIYWKQIDPTQANGQFTDVGPSYRAAIFYGNDEEKRIAEGSKEKLGKSGLFDKPIVTEILAAMKFYPAEDYHQKYYRKNEDAFEAFEEGSGRNRFHKKVSEKAKP